MNLSVKEITSEDIGPLLEYWFTATPEFLKGMGADISLLPAKENFRQMMEAQLTADYPQKKAYALIWRVNDRPVGHTNINNITFGKEATMHLHLWDQTLRKSGRGTELLKMSIPYYFRNFEIEQLICEPYALNPAPNRVVERVGFTLEKEYVTVPGSINFEQPVKRWVMTRDAFHALYK